jgi:integrase
MTKTKPPKYCIDKGKKKAFVRVDGRKNYLPGRSGSPESREAYARFEIEWWENSRRPVAERIAPTLPGNEEKPLVKEVALQFLRYVEATKTKSNFTHYRIATMDFLVEHYGSTHADDFNAGSLNLAREAMIQSRRFCRKQVNDYARRIVTLFSWGVSVGLVNRMVAWELSLVKPLEPGHPGTFDHPEREYVQDWVIVATLPLLPRTLQAMIKLQRLTAMRPSEVFNMRVGDIDRTSVPGVWVYRLASHKTQKKTGKKRVISLNEREQALIAPYLEGKKATDAVFSPRTAMIERHPNWKVNTRVGEFYNKDSYRIAVLRAIEKANRRLPEEQLIPKWTPYELRHSGASAISVELGGEAVQLTMGHTSPTTTALYLHREVEKMTKLALERMSHSPFEE